MFIPLPENTRFHENTGPVVAKQGARAPPPAPAMHVEPGAPRGGGSSTGLSWGLMELPQHDPDPLHCGLVLPGVCLLTLSLP